MDIIARLPHDLNTKFKACQTYKNSKCSVRYILRIYHISKASLMRWMQVFDGTKESLMNKSHRPHSEHPNAHTPEEIAIIKNYIRRNPDIGLNELYSRLRLNASYSRHFVSLYRLLRRIGYYEDKRVKNTKYIPKPYDTPINIGEKMQLDVKFVPNSCKAKGQMEDTKFYQYTIIDEATRERFIYPYNEHSTYSTLDFIKRAIVYFGYIPSCIQTDNGTEFTYTRETNKTHPFTAFCKELSIEHKTIRARTPRHNGKVERSHRNDQERFYNYLSFYSYDDLKKQMKTYLARSNSILISTLNWMSPLQKRQQLESENLTGYKPIDKFFNKEQVSHH